MAKSAAYQLGYDAYLGPMRSKTNPYPMGTADHGDWWCGFNASQADHSW